MSASQLPPDRTTPTRRPACCSRSASRPASAIAPDGSGSWWVVRSSTRIASAVASSDTARTRAAPRTISATAPGTGARQATPSTKVAASGGRDHLPRLERQGGGRCLVGDHSDDLGGQAEDVTDPDESADARTHPDRHVDRVERPGGVEQLQRIGPHPHDEVGVERWHRLEAELGLEAHGVLAGLLVVPAVDDQLGAEALHRSVLVGAVALRHDDDDAQTRRAPGIRQRLAVVATRGGDEALDLGALAAGAVRVDQPAPDLESPCGRVVLVLDPHLRTDVFAEQRPGELGSGGEVAAHDRGRRVELGAGEGHARKSARGP